MEAGAKRVGTGAERALGQSNLHRWKSPLRLRCGRGFEREDGEGAAEEEESGELRQTRRGRAPPPRLEKQLPQGHFLIHPARRLVVARGTRLYSLPSSNPAGVYRPRNLVATQGREEKTNPRNENAARMFTGGGRRAAVSRRPSARTNNRWDIFNGLDAARPLRACLISGLQGAWLPGQPQPG